MQWPIGLQSILLSPTQHSHHHHTPSDPPSPVPPPRQVLYEPLPVVHISAVQAAQRRSVGVFHAPCYRTKARTGLRYIDSLALRTDQPPGKWVLRGVAVLCTAD